MAPLPVVIQLLRSRVAMYNPHSPEVRASTHLPQAYHQLDLFLCPDSPVRPSGSCDRIERVEFGVCQDVRTQPLGPCPSPIVHHPFSPDWTSALWSHLGPRRDLRSQRRGGRDPESKPQIFYLQSGMLEVLVKREVVSQ